MRFLTTKALILVCSGMCMTTFCVNVASADSVTYVYRGNAFIETDGEPGIFSTKDRVTGRFTLDCSVAHFAGTCTDLPYDNYLALGAVELEPLSFSAGPASLPTADGDADINAFFFSTDSKGQIVDWDIDLFLHDPSGVINVDTDNAVNRPIDSAAALGGGGVVFDNPGKWKEHRHPDRRSMPIVNDRNRTCGNWAGGGYCEYFGNISRCWDIQGVENYDINGTTEYVEVGISNSFHWFDPADGSWIDAYRYLSCPVDLSAISANPNRVTIEATLDASLPGCFSYGNRSSWNPENGYQHFPYEFFGLTEVSGEWIDPLTTGKSVTNRKDEYYDPWSDTTIQTSQHCNENWGNMMSGGGFSIKQHPFCTFGYPSNATSLLKTT